MSTQSLLDERGSLALVRAVVSGDAAAAIELVDADTVLDVPRLPLAVGASGIASALAESQSAYPYGLIDVAHHHSIIGAEGRVHEVRARLLVADREVLLPIAVIDSVVSARRHVRLYHSTRLITGERAGRRAVFPVDPSAEPTPPGQVHPVVGVYLAAIASGDPDAVFSRFALGGSIDNGVRPVSGSDELRAVFTAMTRSGGVRLVRWNEIDDGRTVAFEYSGLPRPNVAGSPPRTPPGGGVGVYTYAVDGRIVRVRTYDDFDPDALIALGSTGVDSDHSP